MNRKTFFKSLLAMVGLGSLCKTEAAESLEGWTCTIETGECIDLTQPTEEELAFYRGEQWPKDLLEARTKAGRPCLVINRLPELVDKLMAEHGGGPEHYPIAIATIVRSYRDDQVLLNYLASRKAEFEADGRIIYPSRIHNSDLPGTIESGDYEFLTLPHI